MPEPYSDDLSFKKAVPAKNFYSLPMDDDYEDDFISN